MTGATIDFPLAEARSILVVKPSSLGDIVHALPAVAAIRTAAPQATISWIANTEWMPLIEGSPVVDRVVAHPRRSFRGLAGAAKYPGWLRQLREELGKTDLALDFQGLLRSGLMCRASQAKCVVGLADSREGARFFHHHRVEVPESCHAVDRYLLLPRALGIETPTEAITFPLPEGSPPEDRVEPLPGVYFALHPYSRGKGKSLSSKDITQLCEALQPMPVVLLGVSDSPAHALPGNVIDLTNQTSLAQLIHLLRGASFTISVDSGPMHIAAAISDRILGLFSWSDPRLVGPYPPESWIWKNGAIFQRRDCSSSLDPAAATKRHSGTVEIDPERIADFVHEQAREIDR